MRQAVLNLEESRIREVANAGMGRDDVLAFWFGESDEVTPDFIRQAAIESLQRGETFYSHNLGLPELRQAVSTYMSALHGPVESGRIAITSGGVNALMIAIQALVDAGDEVVAVTPVWPNLTAQPAILGANVRTVPLKATGGEWSLDLPTLLAAITAKTKVLIVNAPNNPTGWTLTGAEQQTLLDHCRRTGTWILADEVYERLKMSASVNHRSLNSEIIARLEAQVLPRKSAAEQLSAIRATRDRLTACQPVGSRRYSTTERCLMPQSSTSRVATAACSERSKTRFETTLVVRP